jgi:sulfotransferase
MNNVMFLSGLPRSGSTVLANILGMHPEINATPSSSLCATLQAMRNSWSQDAFFKAQLDHNFDEMNKKAHRAIQSVIRAWSFDENKKLTIDKSRGWLFCAEWLRDVIPDFKMIVTIRDLRDVYTSVERQHRKTLLINFPDETNYNLVDVRANTLFSNAGVIGGPINAIYNIGDIPDITNNLFIWRYEDFIKDPKNTIDNTFKYLGVEPIEIDFDNLVQNTHESDSHYNMKYPHIVKPSLVDPNKTSSKISPRILNAITAKYDWFYKSYYPETEQQKMPTDKPINLFDRDTETLIQQTELLVKKETKL